MILIHRILKHWYGIGETETLIFLQRYTDVKIYNMRSTFSSAGQSRRGRWDHNDHVLINIWKPTIKIQSIMNIWNRKILAESKTEIKSKNAKASIIAEEHKQIEHEGRRRATKHCRIGVSEDTGLSSDVLFFAKIHTAISSRDMFNSFHVWRVHGFAHEFSKKENWSYCVICCPEVTDLQSEIGCTSSILIPSWKF